MGGRLQVIGDGGQGPGEDRSFPLSPIPCSLYPVTIMNERSVAIVTGAGSGVGREVCRLLADEGYALALVGRREAALKETIALLPHGADRAIPVPADLGAPDAGQSIVGRVLHRWNRVDVLVNNAGLAGLTPLHDATWQELERSFAVNLFGPFMLVAALWPIFERRRSGCVVNVSSMSTVDPFPGLGIYGAAKAGLENLTRSIDNEGRDYGLRAFSIAPGAIETEMLRAMFSSDDLPTEYTLSPADVASVIAACIRGEREADIGRTIHLPNP